MPVGNLKFQKLSHHGSEDYGFLCTSKDDALGQSHTGENRHGLYSAGGLKGFVGEKWYKMLDSNRPIHARLQLSQHRVGITVEFYLRLPTLVRCYRKTNIIVLSNKKSW